MMIFFVVVKVRLKQMTHTRPQRFSIKSLMSSLKSILIAQYCLFSIVYF